MEAQVDLPILDDILPPQRPSVHDEPLDLTFANGGQISLLVDALPGCGGITWPAGEVDVLRIISLSLHNHDSPSLKVLANYLASEYPSLSGHHVLELGPYECVPLKSKINVSAYQIL